VPDKVSRSAFTYLEYGAVYIGIGLSLYTIGTTEIPTRRIDYLDRCVRIFVHEYSLALNS